MLNVKNIVQNIHTRQWQNEYKEKLLEKHSFDEHSYVGYFKWYKRDSILEGNISYLTASEISAHTSRGSKLSGSPLDCIVAFESDCIPWITTYLPFFTPAFVYFSSTTSFNFLESDILSGGTTCRGTLRNGLPSQSSIWWYLVRQTHRKWSSVKEKFRENLPNVSLNTIS